MYEKYSRQCLPSKQYREILGSAICVFNSNNSFIIENILNTDQAKNFKWSILIDKVSGHLLPIIEKIITTKSNNEIAKLFREIIAERNRIIHSYQATDSTASTDDPDHQILITKHKDGRQEPITEEYLLKFIAKNQKLSTLLYSYRDSLKNDTK